MQFKLPLNLGISTRKLFIAVLANAELGGSCERSEVFALPCSKFTPTALAFKTCENQTAPLPLAEVRQVSWLLSGLEMICAELVAGACLHCNHAEIVLRSVSRYIPVPARPTTAGLSIGGRPKTSSDRA